MTLSKRFKSNISAILKESNFKLYGNYYGQEIQDCLLVVGINYSSKTSNDTLYFTVEIAIKNKKVLYCQGYESEFNLMNSHILMSIESPESKNQWLIVTESNFSEIIAFINNKINACKTELLQYCIEPMKMLNHFIYLAANHPLFSHEIIESLLCLTAIYNPSQLNDSLTVALEKAKDKYDEQFINEMIRKFSK
jgi:hypothetical protein